MEIGKWKGKGRAALDRIDLADMGRSVLRPYIFWAQITSS
jgi:hypothetical protein